MNRERWLEVGPHLDRALEMDTDERAAWLDTLRAEDPRLAADLTELLAERSAVGREGFLESEGPAHPAAASLAGQTVGAYTLVAPIGRGGMGTVWLARRSDGRFTGEAAVKFLNAEMGRAGEGRFRREGNILARLTHPHIAHLIDAGVSAAGQPYLVLERVEGQPIDRHCDARGLDVAARLSLFLDVLAAVEHAHSHLVVHRDIKPSNVLVSADGQVKLLDFGIAKLLEGDATGNPTALTREGGKALTPEYAAPEQVTGGVITTATDVYSLGVLLYILLGGRHPAGAARNSPVELLRAILDVEPPRLSTGVVDARTETTATLADNAARRGSTPEKLHRLLRGDLDTIVAKALKKQPEERYASASAFADDVRRYLDHRPITARPDALSYRAARFIRRHRVPVALATLALAALVAGLVGTVSQTRRATRQAALAREQRDFALRQLSRAEAINELNNFLLSDAAPSGKPLRVGDLLDRAAKIVARQSAEPAEIRAEMLIAIGRQFHSQDEDVKALPLLTEAYRLAKESGDRSAEGKAACALGSTVSRQGDAERAETLFQEGMSRLGEESLHSLDRVFCLLRGGEVARNLEDPSNAVARVEAAQRLLRESGHGSTLLDLRVDMDLAESYRKAGRMADANEAFARASARLEAAGRGDTETAGTLLNNWALVVAVANPLRAEALYRQAVDIASADGSDASVSPMLLNNLARTVHALGRHTEAKAIALRAYDEARRFQDELVVTHSLFLQPLIYLELGEVEAASEVLSRLAARVQGGYPPGHYFFAILASAQGLLDRARGDLGAARAAQDRAIALAETTPQANAALPAMLLRRSALELQSGELAPARADAARALELRLQAVEPGALASSVGVAHLALGRALAAQGDRAGARDAFESALRHLEPTLGAAHADTTAARELLKAANTS